MKYCIGPMNVIHMYIYIYFKFVGLREKTLGLYLLPYYIPSIIQHVFQNIKFIYNMQCVIIILFYSQKMQWSMRIGLFLETRKLALKEHVAYRSQSALHSFK